MSELTPAETLLICLGLVSGFSMLFCVLQGVAEWLEKRWPAAGHDL